MTRTLRIGMVLATAVVLTTSLVTSAGATPHGAPQSNSSFAGYQVSKPTVHINKVTATFVVPTITCKKNFSGVGPSVSVQTTPNKKNIFWSEVAAVGVGCTNKQPEYVSIVTVGRHNYNDLQFAAGDTIVATVITKKTKTSVSIEDTTSGAHETKTGKGATGATAYLGDLGLVINHRKTGLDAFSKTSFTNATVNGKSLAAQKAQAFNWTHGKTVLVTVSKLTKGKDFDLTFEHSS